MSIEAVKSGHFRRFVLSNVDSSSSTTSRAIGYSVTYHFIERYNKPCNRQVRRIGSVEDQKDTTASQQCTRTAKRDPTCVGSRQASDVELLPRTCFGITVSNLSSQSDGVITHQHDLPDWYDGQYSGAKKEHICFYVLFTVSRRAGRKQSGRDRSSTTNFQDCERGGL